MENFDIDTSDLDHNAEAANLSLKRKIMKKSVKDIDNQNTEIWFENAPFSSHTEGFIFAIQEKEIYTNHLAAKRDKEDNKFARCRLCKTENENTHHIIACCPKLSASMTE